MNYYSERFTSRKDLTRFMNAKEIQPDEIISINVGVELGQSIFYLFYLA